MRSTLFAASLASLFLFASCEKDNNDCSDCVLLSYAQTQCADPWGYGADGSDVAIQYAVRDFFASRGTVVDEIRIYGSSQPITNCTACSCPTGKTISASVNAADSATFTSLGFYK